MDYVAVEKLPKPDRRLSGSYPATHNRLRSMLDKFMADKTRIAKVVWSFTEYVSIASARGSIRVAIERCGYPMTVRIINNQIYLIKK